MGTTTARALAIYTRFFIDLPLLDLTGSENPHDSLPIIVVCDDRERRS